MTKANDVSAYIPTNVISITDGQIFLQSDLFNANQRPAVDVGISVSRVGGAAQTKAMKGVSGTLKIDLAQYRDMQAFAMFASDLDATSKRQLERGARLIELLRQRQYNPYPMAHQVVAIWAGTTGRLDDVPVEDVLRFERELLTHLSDTTSILTSIEETSTFDDDLAATLAKEIDGFKGGFRTSDGRLLGIAVGAPEVTDKDIEQARIVAAKRV